MRSFYQDRLETNTGQALKSIRCSKMETSEKMAQRIIEWTREVLNCDKGRLFMKDPKRDVMWGTDGGIYSQLSLTDATSSLQGWCANNGKPVRVTDAYVDPRFNRTEDVRMQYLLRPKLAQQPVRFKLGGRPVLNAHLNVETAGSERKRPEI